MTDPKTLAEEIVGMLAEWRCYDHVRRPFVEEIESLLREVFEEAKKEWQENQLHLAGHWIRTEDYQHKLNEAQAAAYADAAKIAETEEVLDGPIPHNVLDATMSDPERALRSAVRATKKNIVNHIRSRAEEL